MAGEDKKTDILPSGQGDKAEKTDAGSFPTPESSTIGDDTANKGKGAEEKEPGIEAKQNGEPSSHPADEEANDNELNEALEKDSDAASIVSWASSRSAFGFEPDPLDESRWVRMSEVKRNVYNEFSNARILDTLFVDIKRKAREVAKKSAPNKPDIKPPGTVTLPEIRRMEWDEFKPIHRRFATGQANRLPPVPLPPDVPPPPPPQPSRPLYVIEVLVDEPWRVKRAANAQAVLSDEAPQETDGTKSPATGQEDTVGPLPSTISHQGGSNMAAPRTSRSRPSSVYMSGFKMTRDPSVSEPAQKPARQIPARVRIRSKPLLAVLREVCNANWGSEVKDMVFFRPFKLFSKYKDAILEEYQRLVDDHPGLDPEVAIQQIQTSNPPTSRDKFVFLPKDMTDESTGKDESSRETDGKSSDKKKDDVEDGGFEMKMMENPPPGAEKSLNLFLDMHLLVKLINEDLKPLFEIREQIQSFTYKSIVFEDLWHLYDYGQEVLIPENGEVSVFRVLKFTGGRETKPGGSTSYPMPIHKEGVSLDRQDAFNVQCWRLAFDGKNYVPVQKTVEIRRYESAREIASLPVYPIRFDQHHWQNRHKLVEQGKAFERYATGDGKGSIHQTYQGPNLEEESKGQHIDSEVIIDFQEAFNHNDFWLPLQINPEVHSIGHDLRELHEHNTENADCSGPIGCTCTTNHTDYRQDLDEFNEFLRDNKHVIAAKAELAGDEDVILLPKEVYGFVLKDRSWAVLSTAPERLHDLEATDPWEDLVIPQEVRSTVEALVERHVDRDRRAARSGKANFGDFIRGKVFIPLVLLNLQKG